MLTRRKRDKHDHLNKSSQPPHPRLKRCNSLKVATAQRYLAKKPHITSPSFGDLHQPCPMKDVYPSPKKLTYPTKRAIRKIIDSKVPFKGGYAGSQKGKSGKLCDSFLFIPILLENAGRSSGRFQPSVGDFNPQWQALLRGLAVGYTCNNGSQEMDLEQGRVSKY